jgi:hypothetical protein
LNTAAAGIGQHENGDDVSEKKYTLLQRNIIFSLLLC